MKRIAVVTATRAEYGLLSPVIQALRVYENKECVVALIVTGTHLTENYGMTVKEIEEEGCRIDYRIEIPVSSSSSLDISHNQAQALIQFTELFSEQRFQAVILLGDRYETLAIAMAAVNTQTPVFHLCGGDITEGAIDDCIRHSITKMSYLHFVSNEQSRKRVIQLGEAPERVFNYGSPGIDNIMKKADMEKAEALKRIGLKDCAYALCTYHPVTLGDENVDRQLTNFLDAIRNTPDIEFLVTKSNADQGGEHINKILEKAEGLISNMHVYSSLGVRKYLSLMKYAEFALGNSSSGIMEAPSFGIPTINIGDRQRGRLRAVSIIDCEEDTVSIIHAITKAKSRCFQEVCRQTENPYGKGNAAVQIAGKIMETLQQKLDLKKKFYDLGTYR